MDWKTNRKPTPLSRLRSRVQTRLYPFLLSLAGAHLNGGAAVQPAQIEMIYWFSADPTRPVTIAYSQAQCEVDGEFIAALIAQIRALDPPFALTADERQCQYCNYRSLCRRGVTAGRDAEGESAGEEGDLLSDFDFDQVAEIEF